MAGYCSTSDVYNRTGLTATDIGTAELEILVGRASIELNNQLNVKCEEERVQYFGVPWKENDQDSSNTVFYTQYYPLGDADDNFSVGTADIEVFKWDGTTKTTLTVSTISNTEEGEFTLSSAPDPGDTLYVTYEYLPIKITDKMIEKACVELSAYYAIKRLHGRGFRKWKIGAISIDKGDSVGKEFFDEYDRTLHQIRRKRLWKVKGGDLMKMPYDSEQL